MDRRLFLTNVSSLWLAASAGLSSSQPAMAKEPGTVSKLVKPKSAWRALLPADSYAVLFEEDTEPPFSSPLNEEKHGGTFVCAACYLPLFESAKKFDSGTGWPSFWDAKPGAIDRKKDYKLIMARTEYHCARCGGHQGHVFDDGPPPTRLRYCNNGLALRFVPSNETLPALRS